MSSVGCRWVPPQGLPFDNHSRLQQPASDGWSLLGVQSIGPFAQFRTCLQGHPNSRAPCGNAGASVLLPQSTTPPSAQPASLTPVQWCSPEGPPNPPDLQANFCPRISVHTPSRLLLGQNLDSYQMAITPLAISKCLEISFDQNSQRNLHLFPMTAITNYY